MSIPDWLPPLVCAAIGTAIVVVMTLRARANEAQHGVRAVVARDTAQLACTICQKQMVIPAEDLKPLQGVEMALCVRDNPALAGRKLAEYTCPYCEATHVFAVDKRAPEWVGANMFSPQSKGTRCLNCSKPLRTAPWGEGAYDKRLNEAPLQPDYGLQCSKCNAVVCVACTLDATRNRTKDGSFVCPRCFRSPVDRTYHPI
ncbi:MAG TPA: hypothetical protein PLJ47_06095 [Candidatus Hydrogenedentes bacterium]|nr:hypothetical protein [Candidatus Hydrogenedentota bacterium]HRK34149.1 hypothetical protein [Candidatus Hydrogenedentota bacterium]